MTRSQYSYDSRDPGPYPYEIRDTTPISYGYGDLSLLTRSQCFKTVGRARVRRQIQDTDPRDSGDSSE